MVKEIAVTHNDLLGVVIIGAGFAGINLVKSLQDKPVQLDAPEPRTHH